MSIVCCVLQFGVLHFSSRLASQWLWHWSTWSKHLLAVAWRNSYHGLPWCFGVYILDTICSNGR